MRTSLPSLTASMLPTERLLDGRFIEGKKEIVQSRLPVFYNPTLLHPCSVAELLDGLLYEEDIPTFAGVYRLPPDSLQQGAAHDGD